MDEPKQQVVQEPPKTVAEKKRDKDKIPLVRSKLPPAVFTLGGRVAAGEMGMKEAREELRRWVAALTDEEKEQLKSDSDRISRTLVLAAEALGQELTILVASL
jgi:hypothetical protein